jgi:NAD(P)-dependent dehydrogenase (short-subunit alcohol dehydrogenase family)
VGVAQRLGRFSGLIHAAGVLQPGPFIWEIEGSQAAEVVEASFLAALTLIRHVVPALQNRGKALIVLFGSGVVEMHLPGLGVYSAAKAAEEFLGRQLAVEEEGLTTVIFRPGLVETRMMEQARSAQGGAGAEMRPKYKAFQEEGLLAEPGTPAKALMKILEDPRRFHGRTVTAEQLLFPEKTNH